MATYNTVVAGTTITAVWGNNVRDGLLNTFASAAARTSAITAPTETLITALTDTDVVDIYTGSAYLTIAAYGAEVDYSSSLSITASISNPTKGNSTYAAKYRQIGKLVHFSALITIGSTFSAGSGTYRFSLPVTASASGLAQDIGSAWVNDSGTALRVGICKLQSTTTAEIYISNVSGGALDSSGPGTAWANNDGIQLALIYEAA